MIRYFEEPDHLLAFHDFYVPIQYDGRTYPSSAHAYEAAKTQDNDARQMLTREVSLWDLTRHFDLRVWPTTDWPDRRAIVLMGICWYKFCTQRGCRDALLATGDANLIYRRESVTNEDAYYLGVDRWTMRGHNQLGRTLMRIRETLRGHP